MQKLLAELENTPRNAPQVPCSVSSELNREETLSVQNKVLANNNSDVDQHQHTGELKAIVYVLSIDGHP